MYSRRSYKNLLLTAAILLGIAHSVYTFRTKALVKRSQLRHRLLESPINGTVRSKRQLFREDIPHHRPLSGNTYYLHAGFPHPSRWHEGPQIIPPNPNPITHHHHQHHHQHLHDHPQLQHDHHHENNGLLLSPPPFVALPVRHKNPHSVSIHSDIVHTSGVVGGPIDNSIANPLPGPPGDQANFDPILPHGPPPPLHHHPGRRPHRPHKPHSDPETSEEYGGPGPGDDYPSKEYGGPPPPPLGPPGTSHPEHYGPPGFTPLRKPPSTRKPKTVIHYHPVSVGNIINFNDDHKPVVFNPNSYGPPKHRIPHPNKDVMLSMAEPFIKTPFKSVSGNPDFLNFNKHPPQYGPPGHEPGPVLDSYNFAPMEPSYGPPVKPDPIPPHSVALPVLAHFASQPPRHPKRYRGGPKNVHFHHFHHSPPPPPHGAESPFFDVKYPTYVVQGHVPHNKFPFHSPHFSSRAQLKSFWSSL